MYFIVNCDAILSSFKIKFYVCMVIITAGHGDHVYGYGKHYNYFLVKICGLFYNMAHANCITSYLCASFESYQFV